MPVEETRGRHILVRRIRADDGPMLRALRLTALADAPEVFDAVLDDELRRPAGDWDEQARAGASAADSTILFVEVDGTAAGLVAGYTSGYTSAGEPRVRGLASMWVAPSARGTGAADALVRALVAWARATGAEAVKLWVVPGNRPARRLYERHGFEVTGSAQPVTDDPTVKVYLPMRLPLVG